MTNFKVLNSYFQDIILISSAIYFRKSTWLHIHNSLKLFGRSSGPVDWPVWWVSVVIDIPLQCYAYLSFQCHYRWKMLIYYLAFRYFLIEILSLHSTLLLIADYEIVVCLYQPTISSQKLHVFLFYFEFWIIIWHSVIYEKLFGRSSRLSTRTDSTNYEFNCYMLFAASVTINDAF